MTGLGRLSTVYTRQESTIAPRSPHRGWPTTEKSRSETLDFQGLGRKSEKRSLFPFTRNGFLVGFKRREDKPRQNNNETMIAIIKPLPSNQLKNIIGDDHRARLSKHRAIIILGEDNNGILDVEEIKTGLVYHAEKKHIMRVSSATKDQLAELV